MSVTQLSPSASAQIRTKRVWTLAGSLPHEDEVWTWADAKALGMEWSDFQWLSGNNLIRTVEAGYRTPQNLADAVRHYADAYDSVNCPGGDPLPRLPEESE
ncbi:hypothetical protein AUR64_17390 [Haloprofundus marisrubri]|uniref:Uncharacterized protein n=1 Tax=Haloprofundus marisrubri TaxID=1514971 RepID=A0A0W1R4W6_9EURY|nr:hypothetical protein [Haloprofundus marisrubri]KTG08457.1 hypothetical protein AUR64_17390 [Haloprofundus marisrubri]